MLSLKTGQTGDLADWAPTRQSLLGRLRDWNDQESWKVFFDTYWKLIYSTAMRAGLTDAEAQDVVQETVISVSKSMPTFEYDAAKGSFRGWLRQLTRWKINDQVRNRPKEFDSQKDEPSSTTDADASEDISDPAAASLDAIWDEEWETNLVEAAIERVKRKVDAKQYQLFDLYVFKKWPVSKVALTLKVNPGRVYLAKHRIGGLIKREISSLRAKPI